MKKCKQCSGTNIVRAESFDGHDPSYLANWWCNDCKEYKFPHNLEYLED